MIDLVIKSITEDAIEVDGMECTAELQDFIMEVKKLWYCGCRHGRKALKNGAGIETPEMQCTINVAYTIFKRGDGFTVRLIHNTAYEAYLVDSNRCPTARMTAREISYAMALMIQAIAEKIAEIDDQQQSV